MRSWTGVPDKEASEFILVYLIPVNTETHWWYILINRCWGQPGSAASVSQHVSQFDNTVKGELRMATSTMASLEAWCLWKYTDRQTTTTKNLVRCPTVHSIQPCCHCVFAKLNWRDGDSSAERWQPGNSNSSHQLKWFCWECEHK